MVETIDTCIRRFAASYSMLLLRISVGIVFLWFGILKLLDASPVVPIITGAYPFFPMPLTLYAIGITEAMLGLLLLTNKFVRVAVIGIWMEMGGILGAPLFNPSMFFSGNPLYLTLEGEFIVKNLVLLAATLVVYKEKAERGET